VASGLDPPRAPSREPPAHRRACAAAAGATLPARAMGDLPAPAWAGGSAPPALLPGPAAPVAPVLGAVDGSGCAPQSSAPQAPALPGPAGDAAGDGDGYGGDAGLPDLPAVLTQPLQAPFAAHQHSYPMMNSMYGPTWRPPLPMYAYESAGDASALGDGPPVTAQRWDGMNRPMLMQPVSRPTHHMGYSIPPAYMMPPAFVPAMGYPPGVQYVPVAPPRYSDGTMSMLPPPSMYYQPHPQSFPKVDGPEPLPRRKRGRPKLKGAKPAGPRRRGRPPLARKAAAASASAPSASGTTSAPQPQPPTQPDNDRQPDVPRQASKRQIEPTVDDLGGTDAPPQAEAKRPKTKDAASLLSGLGHVAQGAEQPPPSDTPAGQSPAAIAPVGDAAAASGVVQQEGAARAPAEWPALTDDEKALLSTDTDESQESTVSDGA
jgi:hypothetical protein